MLRTSICTTCFIERRESALFSRAEVLLMLRTYQVHPGDFSAIVETMVESIHFLDEEQSMSTPNGPTLDVLTSHGIQHMTTHPTSVNMSTMDGENSRVPPRQTDRLTDGRMRFNVPALLRKRGTIKRPHLPSMVT